MRVLITGAGGQLGRALTAALTTHELVALDHGALDITDVRAVEKALTATRPDLVINAAAWTDTAGCEREPARAMLINGEAPGLLAQACRRSGAAMLQISSNEVFDGNKGAPYDEDDLPAPVNEYGRSKLEGERRVREALDRHYIVRTSWLYGPGRVSFPEKILAVAQEGGPLRLVTDEIASPTWTLDLARAIARLIEREEWGTYHLTNSGACSRQEFAEEVLRLAGMVVEVVSVGQAEFGAPYRKPVNSTLGNRRAAALGIVMRPWREALADHLQLIERRANPVSSSKTSAQT